MKKRLLTAWIIACMFICLVGQTPITALAEGDDTRVISVPEGLQELLVNESEIQTAEEENTTEEIAEVQGEDTVGEATEGQGTAQVGTGEDVQAGQGETVVGDAQNNNDFSSQIAQSDGSAAQNVQSENSSSQTDTAIATPENQTIQGESSDGKSTVQNETTDAQSSQGDKVASENPDNQNDTINALNAQDENDSEYTEVIEKNLTASIVASDGNTYETNVTYTSESGIPMEGTVLKVTELVAEDEGYDEYLEESASKVGVDTEDIVFSKVFDIKIVDANDENIEYEPTGNVDVSIRVVGMPLDEFANLNVLHFVEDKNDENYLVYDVETTVSEETVEFSTDSFSVYVVIGHEGGIVENPRVMFHFIDKDATENGSGSSIYYAGSPYEFINDKGNNQTTQILVDGESLEMIKDPDNSTDSYFYGWYVVDSEFIDGTTDNYGIGTDGKLYYTWPASPQLIPFESEITIPEKNVSINTSVSWSFSNGVSGSGEVDPNGDVHVFLAPVFKDYNFVNFMKLPYTSSSNNLITRKLIAKGSSEEVNVKISDVEVQSEDPKYRVFVGWDIFNESTHEWEWYQTKNYDNSIIEKYININIADKDSVDLYPHFVEARWVNYSCGPAGCGAEYVNSHFLESWGNSPSDLVQGMTEVEQKTIFSTLDTTSRKGYDFKGWYAFAVTDPQTGEIINKNTPTVVSISYVDKENNYNLTTVEVETTAIKVADDNGSIINNNGTWGLKYDSVQDEYVITDADPDYTLFSTNNGKLKFYNWLDSLTLYADWTPGSSKITFVYWTENALLEGYNPQTVEECYSASASVTYTTDQLTSWYGTNGAEYYSGTTLHLNTDTNDDYNINNFKLYLDEGNGNYAIATNGNESVNLLSTSALKALNAVPEGEEIFFELNTDETIGTKKVQDKDEYGIPKLDNDYRPIYIDQAAMPETEVVINGDGDTIFNVYFRRMTFKLVFHIGRDHYLKNAGKQRPNTTISEWFDNPNWIEYMYKDNKVKQVVGRVGRGQNSYYSKNADDSYNEFVMMYYPNGVNTTDPNDIESYNSSYDTNQYNIMGDYLPKDDPTDPDYMNDQNLYVITAKYGAYIGNQWPSPTNSEYFTFTEKWTDTSQNPNKDKTLYIWTAFYNSLYASIANNRDVGLGGNDNGRNPDINGVYNYMSKELCANRDGNAVINGNHVHHLVAYFGEDDPTNNLSKNRFKQYHFLYEAIEGTYDKNDSHITEYDGATFLNESEYGTTTWTRGLETPYDIANHTFYEISSESPKSVISNVDPEYQLSDALDGYKQVYSCYKKAKVPSATVPNRDESHIYFFYTPETYTLKFMYEDSNGDPASDSYSFYYKETLEGDYQPTSQKDGYTFEGWYTNEAGAGTQYLFETVYDSNDPNVIISEANRMPDHNVVLYPKMVPIQYLVKFDPAGGVIDHINYDKPDEDYYKIAAYTNHNVTTGGDINGNGAVNSGHNPSQATYFFGDYNEPIGEYTVERNYIELTSQEQPSYNGEIYYYLNAQFKDQFDGDWGLPPDLRNAVYMTYDQLQNYYLYYKDVITKNSSYYTNVDLTLTETQFLSNYTSYFSQPYRPVSGSEHYTFMGWYRVDRVGSEVRVDEMPYNFNDPVTEPLELRAKWRLDGGYWIKYNPYFINNNTVIIGEMIDDQWTDPGDVLLSNGQFNSQTRLYADQALTNILRAPINTKEPDQWIFRGWRLVRPGVGSIHVDEKDYPNWDAFYGNGNEVFYQPGQTFTVDSSLVSENDEHGGVINLQAYYEPASSSTRRPKIANLKLDANSYQNGQVCQPAGVNLPDLDGSGVQAVVSSENQIKIGDLQSNVAIHLQQYSDFFTNSDLNSKLLGFDYAPDEGDYIATYPLDNIISVQRTDDETIYAVWEPMRYVTFVNKTNKPITVDLSSSNGTSTFSIVNECTGEFDRQATTTTIVIPAKVGDNNGQVKVVLPCANVGDDLTALTHNDHDGLISVSGEDSHGPWGNGQELIPKGLNVKYSGSLVSDSFGIVVTYTETDQLLPRVFYDMNGGTSWTDSSDKYNVITQNELYSINKADIADNNGYEPSKPTRSGMAFVGWTTNEDIAAQTDFSSTDQVSWGETTITPGSSQNVLELVKSDYLWDFSQTPPDDLVLHAVWSETVTVTFDIRRINSSLHTWNGPSTTTTLEPYAYYRSSSSSSDIVYTLAKGEKVPKPADPTTNQSGWTFVRWLLNYTGCRGSVKTPSDANIRNNAYDFSQNVTEDITLSTSWTNKPRQTFTFTVENHVSGGDPDEEFEYTIAVSDVLVWGKMNSSALEYGAPNKDWGSIKTKLKNNEHYTIRITVTQETTNADEYSVWVEVIDGNGIPIKEDWLLECVKQNAHYRVSDYKYTLTVIQTQKSNYSSSVDVNNMIPENSILCTPNSANCSYTFDVEQYTRCPDFSSNDNAFSAGEKNSLTIVFTNTGEEVVAPTGYTTNYKPFFMMLGFGTILLGLIVAPIVMLRRRREEEE